MKKMIFGALLGTLFLLMLCFPRVSFEAAKSGLLLWYGTLVPTLLPVMILSGLLLDTNLAYLIARRISRPLTALLGISPCGVYALIVGFLCGCPMGAKVLSDLRRRNLISQEEASYLVCFCNNISPAFLINFLVLEHLKSASLVAPTLFILFGAPVLYGLFSNYRYRTEARKPAVPEKTASEKNKTSAMAINFAMVDACITDSIFNITKLGGYVTGFAVLTAMSGLLPIKAPLAKALLSGVTEISGGIHAVSALPLSFPWKYLLLTAVSAFGGLCCTAQSAQMLSRIGISVRRYLSARLSIAAIAVIMAVCYVK